ncbi:MAG: hypothetical protein M3O50_01100 [Myxococcota bacterium]|nr:hypothetical protein [Myxococcota bacterium]
MGVPPPGAGLDAKWHVFVIDAVNGGGDARPADRNPVTRFDRVDSYAIVERGITGCKLDLALARAIARGSLWRAAPASDPGSASAQTETLARLSVACAGGDEETLEFQAHPERAVIDPRRPGLGRGGTLFFDWLDKRFGREPGALVTGMWALAPTQTPLDAANWSHTPNDFDVLRVSLKGALWSESTLEDIFVRFGVARQAAVPPARTAWHLPWPVRPRRVLSPQPVSPTGAAYVIIDRAGAPRGAKLRLEMEWEDYGRFRWVVVKLDHTGHAIGELAVTTPDRATRAATTVESLDDADAVLLVGVGLPATPGSFDPHQGEWEPHGWLLTIASDQ